MKKWIIPFLLVGLCLVMAACNFGTAPGSDPNETTPTGESISTEPEVGQVRILNKDPQQQAAWDALAAEYAAQTGVEVAVLNSADGTQPTLLTVSGQEELPENCADLSGSAAYAQLASWDLALRDNAGAVCGIAAEVEVFGLVFNSTLLAQTSHTQADIDSFVDLTEVVYAISEKKDKYGFSAFARFDPNDHFAIQLASLTGDTRNLLDLIINNTTGDPLEIASFTETDALQDFLDEKAVFFLAGSKEQETLNAIGSENMGVLPVYMGGENEERQSLCAAACSYWCIPGSVEGADLQATLDFLDFLVQPRENGTVPVDDLGRMAPYRQASSASNLLESVFRSDLTMGKEPVICRNISQVPEGLAQALIDYAANPSNENWETIATIVEQ